MMNKLVYYEEPRVVFGHSQTAEDSRDGLTLFGPYQTATGSVRIGVIGTKCGISAYEFFANEVNKPVFTKSSGRPFFPGFYAAFGMKWESTPTATITLDFNEIIRLTEVNNLHERTYQLVSLYLGAIKRYIENEEKQVDLWFIVIPKEIWSLCRPKSWSKGATFSKSAMTTHATGQLSLFADEDAKMDEYMVMYESDSDFHDQMKARILSEKIAAPVQIMLEDTLLFKDKKGVQYPDDMKAHLLWTQSTSTFYKLGNLPWKLHNVRDGVCYIGLVFKTLQGYQKRSGYACCAAQMFLDSGDGMVFRGNIGPWKGKNEKTYHLDENSAQELIKVAIESYRANKGVLPKELFIHGRTRFTDEEWRGFSNAVSYFGDSTNLVGVTINESDGLRLYKNNFPGKFKYGIMRGLAFVVNDTDAYLWTKGFIPRTETANHLEVARPLRISVFRGSCNIDTVLKDILCLTKLNYNACIYGDGVPVTLRFSDKIGNILTALKDVDWPAKQFKYYI
jgi:hypothetical protein